MIPNLINLQQLLNQFWGDFISHSMKLQSSETISMSNRGLQVLMGFHKRWKFYIYCQAFAMLIGIIPLDLQITGEKDSFLHVPQLNSLRTLHPFVVKYAIKFSPAIFIVPKQSTMLSKQKEVDVIWNSKQLSYFLKKYFCIYKNNMYIGINLKTHQALDITSIFLITTNTKPNVPNIMFNQDIVCHQIQGSVEILCQQKTSPWINGEPQ